MKLALLFLTYDRHLCSRIWGKWLKEAAEQDIPIFCHAARPHHDLGFLAPYLIDDLIQTGWWCPSLVDAEIRLLRTALEKSDATHFAILSQSCAPVKPLADILLDIEQNPISRCTVVPAEGAIDDCVYKISQWKVWSRATAELGIKLAEEFTPYISHKEHGVPDGLVAAPDEIYWPYAFRQANLFWEEYFHDLGPTRFRFTSGHMETFSARTFTRKRKQWAAQGHWFARKIFENNAEKSRDFNYREEEKRLRNNLTPGVEVHQRGYFLTRDEPEDIDTNLANGIAAFLKAENAQTVADFGCGTAGYTRILLKNGLACEAFDGNPHTAEITSGLGRVLDLTKPRTDLPQYDWSLCLDVGQYIPFEYEEFFLENLTGHSRRGLILSWQHGGNRNFGIINALENGEVIDRLKYTGFLFDPQATAVFRKAASTPRLKSTLMVFRRSAENTPLNFPPIAKHQFPNLFVAGVPQAGSTSLHTFLSRHPDIFMSSTIEPKFFLTAPNEKSPYYQVRLHSYMSLFSGADGKKYRGESSVQYFIQPQVIPHIRKYADEPRFIFTLRNPVDRAYARYAYNVEFHKKQADIRPFREKFQEDRHAPDAPTHGNMYFYGLYYKNLKRYFEAFGPENIHIMIYERWAKNRQQAMNECFNFLGLQTIDLEMPSSLDGNKREQLYKTLGRIWLPVSNTPLGEALDRSGLKSFIRHKIRKPKAPLLSRDDRRWAAAFFKEDVQKLRVLLQDPLPEWEKDFPQ